MLQLSLLLTHAYSVQGSRANIYLVQRGIEYKYSYPTISLHLLYDVPHQPSAGKVLQRVLRETAIKMAFASCCLSHLAWLTS